MRIAAIRTLTIWAALLLLASPVAARAAVPAASCPDILLGDSLAVGMGPYAQAAGFQVIARTGIGLAWLRAQNPRCARRVVVVIGTNDLRGIDPYSAEAYPERLAAIMGRWQTQQIVWATPGCFPRDESLERGSEALDRALAREPLVRVGGRREYMRVHSGRTARCGYLSGDGIHPTGAGYRAWWASLSQAMGPEPEAEPYRETRTARGTDARPPVRAVQHTRLDRQAHAGQQARPSHSVQQARSARPTPSIQQARSNRHPGTARQSRAVQLAHADRRPRNTLQPPSNPPTRSVQQARSGRQTHPASPMRSTQQARSVQNLRPGRDPRQLRAPATLRMEAVTPTRRT
ncbi:MAG: GDSL-like Lipase/Acylhydrolase family [Rubritepida sp.]|nr:GDSL-like Lipase/Acylhydrolase family [Rubritepida sp.]